MNEPATVSIERLRLDKWLWYIRLVKTRTLAQKLVQSGAVRIEGNRITDPAHRLRTGAVLTVTMTHDLRIFKVLELGSRRGPATEAATLYEDLSPVLERAPHKRPIPVAPREPGSGRPTKRDRRDTARLKGWQGGNDGPD